MRRITSMVLFSLFVVGLAATAQVSRANDAPQTPTCVVAWPEARYVVGYDHIVHLYNSCDKTAVCSVATDVNPAPQSVSVPTGTHVEVVTFRGSPASKFIPKVACVMSK